MDGLQGGLATTPCASGLPRANIADNWLDIVNFGGKDAIINSYLITALRKMAEMATFLGGTCSGQFICRIRILPIAPAFGSIYDKIIARSR